MTTSHRLLLATLLVGCLGAAACYLRPDWAEAAGLDLWNVPAGETRLAAEQQRCAEMDESNGEVLRRIDDKQEVVNALVTGRLGLFEAAARFRDLTPAEGGPRRYLRACYPGANDDERFCREILCWVYGMRTSRGPDVKRLVARLEGELHERLRRDGKVALPR
jgi:hypothetical protein